MTTGRWSDQQLQAMRAQGDPLAEAAVAGAAARQISPLEVLRRMRAGDDDLAESLLPGALDAVVVPAETRARSERLFELFGPEILLTLCCYSLPTAYASRRGVAVLVATGALERPLERVYATAGFIRQVLERGGLAPDGAGLRALRRIRLLHAAIRLMLVGRAGLPPGEVPINQEDLAGTLMAFSVVVLHGLGKLGLKLEEEDRQAYVDLWVAAGQVLGIDAQLLPANADQAWELARLIARRQIDPGDDGRSLLHALMNDLDHRHIVKGFAPAVMHHFLSPPSLIDRDLAAEMHIPPPNWARILIPRISRRVRLLRAVSQNPLGEWATRRVRRKLVALMLHPSRTGVNPGNRTERPS